MTVRVLVGDALRELRSLPDSSIQMCMTSPPYWGLRAYKGDPGMIGLEPTFDEHLAALVEVFREVRRVLRDDGTLWLNYGDAYANDGKWGGSTGGKHAAGLHGETGIGRQKVTTGLKPKDLMMMPARVAMALQDDGWWVRSEIIWHKPNPMPESVTDRPTSAHEKLYLLSKAPRYFYDAEAVRVPQAESTLRQFAAGQDRKMGDKAISSDKSETRRFEGKQAILEGGRNLRNVWSVPTHAYSAAHFATFPPKLCDRPIKAGTSERGACPDCGTPWERLVAKSGGTIGRDWSGDPGNTPGSEARISNPQRRGGVHFADGKDYSTETTGWRPVCACYDEGYRRCFPEPKNARKRAQRAAWDGRWKRVRARPAPPEWGSAPCVVLDPFAGAGTVGLVADRLGRDAVLIEISPEYAEMARKRIRSDAPLFNGVA